MTENPNLYIHKDGKVKSIPAQELTDEVRESEIVVDPLQKRVPIQNNLKSVGESGVRMK